MLSYPSNARGQHYITHCFPFRSIPELHKWVLNHCDATAGLGLLTPTSTISFFLPSDQSLTWIKNSTPKVCFLGLLLTQTLKWDFPQKLSLVPRLDSIFGSKQVFGSLSQKEGVRTKQDKAEKGKTPMFFIRRTALVNILLLRYLQKFWSVSQIVTVKFVGWDT